MTIQYNCPKCKAVWSEGEGEIASYIERECVGCHNNAQDLQTLKDSYDHGYADAKAKGVQLLKGEYEAAVQEREAYRTDLIAEVEKLRDDAWKEAEFMCPAGTASYHTCNEIITLLQGGGV